MSKASVWMLSTTTGWFWTSLEGMYPYVWLQDNSGFGYVVTEDDVTYIYKFSDSTWSTF